MLRKVLIENLITAVRLLAAASCLSLAFAQSPVTFLYFYDDAGELFRALDSTGTLIEYIYDPSGNIIQINRSTVARGALSILNIAPLSGATGNSITVYGQNFSTTPANDIVKINGVLATVLSASTTQLVIQIPASATAGQITVTVNGVTVSSGPTLVFTPLPLPVITSVRPDGAVSGTVLPSVSVTGTDMTNGVFTFPAGAAVGTLNVTATSATLQVTPLNTRGVFPLVVTTPVGSSTNAVTSGNHFIVMISPDQAQGQTISVLNTASPVSGTPDPTNVSNQAMSQTVSVLNESLPVSGAPDPTNVSNEADSYLVSLLNNASPMVTSRLVSNSNGTLLPAPLPGRAASGTLQVVNSAGTNTALNGQIITIGITPPNGSTEVDLSVNGTTIMHSTQAPYLFLLNVPANSQELSFTAGARNLAGIELASSAWTQRAVPDPGTEVQGRVVDTSGAPVSGAKVTLEATGVYAEYFKFPSALGSLPDLNSLTAGRITLEAGIEWVNPNGIFGDDPLGTGMSPNYAARFTAGLVVAATGNYAFALQPNAGGQIRIDGQGVAGPIRLTAGTHAIEVLYYKSAEPAQVQLFWTPPNGSAVAIPSDSLIAGSPALSAISARDGTFAISGVPARLGQIRVKVEPSDRLMMQSVWQSPLAGAVTNLGDVVVPAAQ